MKRHQTKAIVLRRVDYEESDRIVTLLTPELGQVTALAKGVRKQKSKMAGGIELFSISDITLMEGKGNLQRIISTRLDTHFGNIISDYARMELGYRITEQVYKATADLAEEGVYDILVESLTALNDIAVDVSLIELRFYLNMLGLHGQLPDLRNDANEDELSEEATYFLDISSGVFQPSERGDVGGDEIKLLRLLSSNPAAKVSKISGVGAVGLRLTRNVRELFEFVF